MDKKAEGISQIVHGWKEKNELCKRALMLVNFYNVTEVRNRALDLVRMIITVSPNDVMQFVVQVIHTSCFSASSQVRMLFFFCFL